MKRFAPWLGAALLCAAFAAPAAAQAADYPDKSIRVIVNFPAGGTIDTLARILGERLSDKLGQPVIVDNRPGAGGNIGTQAVANAPGDGYTLLATPPGPLAINQLLYKDLGYDPAALEPVILLAKVPNGVTVRADFPANSVQELVDYARANPGTVTYGSQGNGSTSHLTGQMFASTIDADMLHIPFRGEGPALTELLGGRVDAFFGNISAVLKFREGNRVKLLGVAAPKPSALAPDVPGVAAGELSDFVASAWFAVMAAPGTPPQITEKLNRELAAILATDDVRERFALQGAEVAGGSPAELAAFIDEERARWKAVIDEAGVTLD